MPPRRAAVDEFRNNTQGWVGVSRITRKGDETSVNVEPGDRIFLTKEEQELTVRAYQRDHNPFDPVEIVHFDLATGEETKRFTAPFLERVAKQAPVAA